MSTHPTVQATTKRRGRPSKKNSTALAAAAAIQDIIDKKGSKKAGKKGNNKRGRQEASAEDPAIEDTDLNTAATDVDMEESASSPASSMASSNGGDGVPIDQLQLNTPKASPGKKFKTKHTSIEKKQPSSARQLFTATPAAAAPIDPQPAARRRLVKQATTDSDVEEGADSDNDPELEPSAVEDNEQPLPTGEESSDDEKGQVPDGGQDDEDMADDRNLKAEHSDSAPVQNDSDHDEDVAEEDAGGSSSESSYGGGSDDDSVPRQRRATARQPPKTPTKDSTQAKAVHRATALRLKAEATPTKKALATPTSTPTKAPKAVPAAAAAAASSSSPIKKWVAPIGTSTFTSVTGGKVSTTAKSYNLRVIVVGDMGSAMNGSSRVSRKNVIAVDIADGKRMIITGFGDDANKYMANLALNHYYTLDLEAKTQTLGKSLCLLGQTTYYKLAMGTKIRPYAIDASMQPTLNALDTTESLCDPIQSLIDTPSEELVNVHGVVMKVTAHPMRNGTGLKIVLADSTGYVSIMFFEAKANIVVGVSLVIIGAKVWTNSRTRALELSIYNTTVVMTNVLPLTSALVKQCRKQDYSKIANVSAVPSQEPRSMHSLKEEAAELKNETDSVSGTVILYLDPNRPAVTGSITYNGCVQCKRKIKVLDEQDEDGNSYYDHEVDRGGESHKALTYNSHFMFNGRFREDGDEAFFVAQVTDDLGVGIFGVTAEVMCGLDEAARAAVMLKATATSYKYNITMIKNGDIQSMIMV